MVTTKNLIADAMHLKPADRFIVIEALVKSLDEPDSAVASAWAEEAEKRLTSFKEGRLETISFEDMFGK